MDWIHQQELDQGKWVDLGTAMIKNVNYNTIGPFPCAVLAPPTTTSLLIDVYAHTLMDFLADEFLESLYLESLMEDPEEGEDDYGFVDYDDEDDPGDFY